MTRGAKQDQSAAVELASARLSLETRVAVTGASGFIGSAIVRGLLQRGADVTAVCEPGTNHANLDGLSVKRVDADVRDQVAITNALCGSHVIFHTAAIYRFWSSDPKSFYEVNVGGTMKVLEAARRNGAELVVYTSSVGTLGLDGVAEHGPADETAPARIDHLFGSYKRSKYVAEHEVLRAAAEGLPVTLVLPTTPLGPCDRGPTPTGRMVVEFLNGRMPGWYDTTLNVVDVDDVAEGHLLAAERGLVGRSYVVGGENLTLREILEFLGLTTGIRAPTLRIPRLIALGAAAASELVEGHLLRREPHIPLEGARMAATEMAFSDARARRELGYRSRPAREAIERSARWFLENGYVSPRRFAKINSRATNATERRGSAF